MLRYYSYYSVGGYKDLFLGDSITNDKRRYYLPLLPMLETQGETDEKKKAELERLAKLPRIEVLGRCNTFGLSEKALTLISHAAYNLILLHLEGDTFALCLREITGENNDVPPFLLLITGEGNDDICILERLVAWMSADMVATKTFLSSIIHYDVETNGYCVEIKKLNEWINNITADNQAVVTVCGHKIEIKARAGAVALLILPKNITVNYTISEQRLEGMALDLILQDGKIVTRQKKVEGLMHSGKKQRKTAPKSNSQDYHGQKWSQSTKIIIAAGTLAAVGIAAYLFVKYV